MNKVCLVGRLTRDPELRTTPSGMAVTRFTIAVSQNYVNKNGERGADFINCVTWGRQAENLSKYCKRGSLISLEGRITNRSYDAQDGTKKYVTEIVSENINFLSSGNQKEQTGNTSNQQRDIQTPNESGTEEDPYEQFSNEIVLTDEDLPF